ADIEWTDGHRACRCTQRATGGKRELEAITLQRRTEMLTGEHQPYGTDRSPDRHVECGPAHARSVCAQIEQLRRHGHLELPDPARVAERPHTLTHPRRCRTAQHRLRGAQIVIRRGTLVIQ